MMCMDAKLVVLLSILAILVPCACIASAQGTINPVYWINGSTSLPTGIGAYGLMNMAKASGFYTVATNEVFGVAKIGSMYAYNASLTQLNVSPYGVSLQLNAMLNVTSDGHVYAYLAQDVADFNTSNMTYYFVDNVWNATDYNATLSNATIEGRGNVTDSYPGSSGLNFTNIFNDIFNYSQGEGGFYAYATNSTPYSYPISFEPVIRVTYNHGYPYLQFGYFSNGTARFYDNVTLLAPNGNAYFQISPFNQTPALPNGINSSLYYDTELVYGGEAEGATINFNQMNSTLWIGYLKNGTIEPFPAVGTFGSETAENATGLSVVQGNGEAVVRTGSLNYNETILLSGVPSGLNVPPPPAPPTVPTTTTVTITTNQQSIPSPSSFPIYDIIIFVIVILVVAFIYTKMKSDEKPPQQASQS